MADRSAMRALMRELAESNKLAKAQNLAQLSNSSVENGPLPVNDADGNEMSRLGAQDDGTFAPVVLSGPVPPTPDGITVAAGPTSLKVAWDGTFTTPVPYQTDGGVVDAWIAPLDFSALEVHASPDSDFVPDPLPDSATRVGIIGQAAGGSLTFQPATATIYIRCMTRAASGKFSNPTDPVDAYGSPPAGSVSDAGVGNFTSAAFAEDPTIQGTPLVGKLLDPTAPAGILDGFAQGVPKRINFVPVVNGITITAGASTTGVGQFTVVLAPGRIYEFQMPWRAYLAAASGQSKVNVTSWLFATYANDASTEPPDPSTSDIPVGHQSQTYADSGTGINDTFTFSVATPARDDNQPVQVKFLLGLWSQYGSVSPDTSQVPDLSNWVATISDKGADPGIVDATVPGSSSKVTYTTTWAATDSHAWTADGSRYDTGGSGRPAAGSLMLQSGVPSHNTHSAVVFNGGGTKGESKTIASALGNGAVIVRAELFLQLVWSENDWGQVEVRSWTGTTLPATKAPPGPSSAIVKHDYSARSQPAWFDIPTSWITAAQTGIWIASPDWGFTEAHINLAGATHATASWRPMLRLTYQR